MLKKIFQLAFAGLCLFMFSNFLQRCETLQGLTHLSGQNQQQTGLILTSAQKDSSRAVLLQSQNDSLKRQNESLLDGNAVLISYAQTSDSLLRMQTDSTRRAKEEAYYIRLREESNSKSIQQMFWVLTNGQEDLRLIVDSVRKESKALIQARHQLENERVAIEQLQNKIPDITPPQPVGLAMEKDSTRTQLENKTRKPKGSSVNNRKRQRQAERRTKKLRKKSLLRG